MVATARVLRLLVTDSFFFSPSYALDRQEPERPKLYLPYLQAVMVEALEDLGGCAHPATLALYAQRVWTNKEWEGADDEYDFQDFRKAVKLELKRNPDMFDRVTGRNSQFLEWTLAPSEQKRRRQTLEKWLAVGFRDAARPVREKSMSDWLRETLEGRSSGTNYKQLELLIENYWQRFGPFGSADLMLMTLQTNPCFHDHDRDPMLWELTLPAATAEARPVGRAAVVIQSPLPMGMMQRSEGAAVAAAAAAADTAGFKRPERSRRRERSPSPIDDGGPRPSLSSRNKRKKEAAADSGQWIQCDRCHKWVAIAMDDKITDLSMYDDANPNHIDYNCPTCREEEEIDAKRSMTRPKRVALEVTAAIDELEKDLVTQFRNSRSYWRRTTPATATAAAQELEEQFLQSLTHCKVRVAKTEEDVGAAKISFRDFFHEQVSHLKVALLVSN